MVHTIERIITHERLIIIARHCKMRFKFNDVHLLKNLWYLVSLPIRVLKFFHLVYQIKIGCPLTTTGNHNLYSINIFTLPIRK